MKITSNKVDWFINNLPNTISAVLIYGPDAGLISERYENIGKKIVADLTDPFSVINLSVDKIKEDHSVLADEFNALNFLGGRRLIRIKDADNNFTSILKKFFSQSHETNSNSAFVIITAGELAAQSSLRKLFEDMPNLAALPCYNDDERTLESIISNRLREAGYKAERDAILYMAANCQGDRQIVMREIEKLQLYLGERKDVSFNDAVASVGKTTESTLDDICHAVADGNIQQVEKHYRRAEQQGESEIAILRTVQKYFIRLRKIKGSLQEGKSVETAISGLRPPVFFKYANKFNHHVKLWTKQGNKIDRVLSELYDAELECKKTGVNPELQTNRCLMRIASLIR